MNGILNGSVKKTQLQSLLGSLLYICKCVKPVGVFLNCMLNLLRDSTNNDTIFLSKEFFKDLNWFSLFLKQFNEVVFMMLDQYQLNCVLVPV